MTTLTDAEWEKAQEDLRNHLPELYDHYENSKHGEVVKDGDQIVVFADGAGVELSELANRVDIPNNLLRKVMHDKARYHTEYDWGHSDPVVVELE